MTSKPVTCITLRKSSGFTLIELMVTCSVVAILAALAIPGFVSIMQNQRRVAEVSDLVVSLNYARSEAVKQDTTTGVSVTANGTWSNGWAVCCTNTGGQISSAAPLDPRATLSVTLAGNTPTAVTFGNSGAQLAALGTVLFTFCDARGAASASAVEVNPSGHIQGGSKAGFRVDQVTPLVCN